MKSELAIGCDRNQQQLKEQQFEVALAAPTMIKVDLTDENQNKSRDKLKGIPGNDQLLPSTAMTGEDRPPDPNGQNEKEDFAGKVHSNTYLAQGREKPLGQWELKVGTLIPGVLISGLNVAPLWGEHGSAAASTVF